MGERLPRYGRIEELRRHLDAARQIIAELEANGTWLRLDVEEGAPWGPALVALSEARKPSVTGSVASCLVALHDALKD